VSDINTEVPSKNTPQNATFRWSYVALPLAALVITLILAVVFYGRLPPDTTYRFSGGVPTNRISRGVFMAWTLGLQLVFVLISLAMTLLITGAARRMQMAANVLNRTVFSIMGNMVAIPQFIIIYAMADILIYNVYGRTLPALWIFALAVLCAGGTVMGILFARAYVQSRKTMIKNTSGSESDAREQTG
jgi:uncharacterized membrane protein